MFKNHTERNQDSEKLTKQAEYKAATAPYCIWNKGVWLLGFLNDKSLYTYMTFMTDDSSSGQSGQFDLW